jgi:hypothetical protein
VSDGYWSSAAYGGFPTAAWGVDFTNGFVNPGYVKSFTFYVRAVRGGS